MKTADRAASLLWLCCYHLEAIAIEAALRGDGIPGQLEDELRHQRLFEQAWRETHPDGSWSPMPDAPPAIQALLDFLMELQGEASVALLNVTAEAWLEQTLHTLARSFPWLAEIEADEARHAAEARDLPLPDSDVAEPLMHKLEELLVGVCREPDFTLPIIHFAGPNAAARMCLNIIAAHRDACKHLRVRPSARIDELERTFEEATRTPEPTPVDMNEWERARAGELFGDQPGQMFHQFDVPFRAPEEWTETLVGQALSYALRMVPEANRTVAGGRLFQCEVPVIGFRRATRKGEVFTVYSRAAHARPLSVLASQLRDQAAAARRTPYCTLPQFKRYSDLTPPSRVAGIVTHIGAFGGVERGWAPIVPGEGNAVTIATTNVRYRPVRLHRWIPWLVRWERYLTINLMADHRVMDGSHIIALSHRIKEFMGG